MMGGFGLNNDLVRFSKPQECSVCHRIFSTPQDLISHLESFHSIHPFSTYSSVAPTTNFRHPSAAFPARNRFDLNYYRAGYIDDQGRFLKGVPPTNKPNFLFGQQKKPNMMDIFQATSSESVRTLPLLCQLEQGKPETTVTENGVAYSRPIDLTLRL